MGKFKEFADIHKAWIEAKDNLWELQETVITLTTNCVTAILEILNITNADFQFTEHRDMDDECINMEYYLSGYSEGDNRLYLLEKLFSAPAFTESKAAIDTDSIFLEIDIQELERLMTYANLPKEELLGFIKLL